MSGSPRRLRLSRQKGYRKPEGAVVVSRPSKYGNPFRVVRRVDGTWWIEGVRGGYQSKDEATVEAVRLYREIVIPTFTDLWQLRGKDLCCWCPFEGPPCHADPLIEFANA